MGSAKAIAGLFIALAIGATLLVPITDAVNANSGEVDVTNESVTADTSSYVDLDGYDVNSGSETVYWKNTSSGNWETVSSPGDYEMNYSTGSIKANSSGKVSTGDDLRVTYTYTATDSMTATVVELAPLFMGLLMLGIMAATVQEMM